MSRPLTVCLILSLLAWSSPAVAQSKAEKKKAQEHFKSGSKLYEDGDFQEALAEFQRGHTVIPNPIFRYNIALCYWRMDRYPEAIKESAKADEELTALGEPQAATLNLSRLVSFRLTMKAREVAEAPPIVVEAQPDIVVAQPVVEDDSSLSPVTWTGLILTVAGAGALVGWGILETSLSGTIEDYEAAAAAGDQGAHVSLRQQIEDKQLTAKILLFTGAGATAIGGGLLVWGLTSGGEVALTPMGAGVRAVVSF